MEAKQRLNGHRGAAGGQVVNGLCQGCRSLWFDPRLSSHTLFGVYMLLVLRVDIFCHQRKMWA